MKYRLLLPLLMGLMCLWNLSALADEAAPQDKTAQEIRFMIFIVNDSIYQVDRLPNLDNWSAFYDSKKAEMDKLKYYARLKKYDEELCALFDEFIAMLDSVSKLDASIKQAIQNGQITYQKRIEATVAAQQEQAANAVQNMSEADQLLLVMMGPATDAVFKMALEKKVQEESQKASAEINKQISTQIQNLQNACGIRQQRHIEKMVLLLDEIMPKYGWKVKNIGGILAKEITDKKEGEELMREMITVDPFITSATLSMVSSFPSSDKEYAHAVKTLTAMIPPGRVFKPYVELVVNRLPKISADNIAKAKAEAEEKAKAKAKAEEKAKAKVEAEEKAKAKAEEKTAEKAE